MGRAEQDGSLAEIGELRRRIERWRQARKKRSPMPEELWAETTELGRFYGAYRISKDLGVNYESLRARIEGFGQVGPPGNRRRRRLPEARIDRQPKFVEIEATPTAFELPGAPGVLIEVQEATGSKLTIRLGAASTIDVCGVLASFREAGLERRRR